MKERRGIQAKQDIGPTNIPGNPDPIQLPIRSLTIDIEIQQRARMSDDLIAEYAVDIANWIKSAPITVITNGQDRWVADGFHRVEAALTAGLDAIFARQHPGTRRDALLFAVCANRTHGLRRTNADKRRAVETLLSDPEWSQWSDRMIADRAGVSHPTVASIRREVEKFTTCDAPTSSAHERATWGNSPPEAPTPIQASAASAISNEPPETEPAKRIGRDGKAYPTPAPRPDPEPVIVEEVEGDDLDAIRTATSKLQAEVSVPELVATTPNPAPAPKGPTAKDAMQTMLQVTGWLGKLSKVEGALLEQDAQTLIKELRKALERLTERFGEPGQEVDHA